MSTKRYKSIICEFMTFKVGHTFAADTIFNQDMLLSITSDDVCRWMNSRAFGDPNPTEDAKPWLGTQYAAKVTPLDPRL
ncbi:hypothetical protein L917_18865 [Phytophthora nicotianae]|uniref:Uncharacterized protein n=1 Tax=Phytophthora nicotianae TaxID=4792 RepID=W2K658_PHYNI|nr:hypothetical protein L917_18865 [Phytophthora nicotianae]